MQADWEIFLSKICAFELLVYLKGSGLICEAGDQVELTMLRASLKVSKEYKYLFNFIIDFLSEFDLVRYANEQVTLLNIPNEFKAESLKVQLAQEQEKVKIAAQFIRSVIKKYPEILSGYSSPFLILFPDGDVESLQEKLSVLINTQDTVLAKDNILTFLLKNFPPSNAFKALEVGAGSGGLTWSLLPFIKQKGVYHFTDKSRFFILRGKRKARELGLDNFVFSTLDLAVDPIKYQREAEKKYDCILAYNVLHVMENIETSVNWLYELLVENGYLILLENTRTSKISSFIWGILPGWWKDNNQKVISDNPLLSLGEWKKVLCETKFESLSFYPDDDSTDAVMIVLQRKA